jgi:oligoendopeptidase F
VRQNLQPTRWSLDDLLPAPSGPAYDQAVAQLEELVSKLEGRRDRLSADMGTDDFEALLNLYESVREGSQRLTYYARLWFSSDTQSQAALGFKGRIDQLAADLRNRVLFFELWWQGLEDEAAGRLLERSGDRRYYLESLRLFKPYMLSEPEEKIINLKDVNGAHALITLYQMITNRYLFRLEVEGEVKELTWSELRSYFRSPSAELREAAYREMNRVYIHDGPALGQIWVHLARDWRSENLALRSFPESISVRNLSNNIPDPVVDTLLEVSRRNAVIFQDYFRLKARWLGMDRLRRYDIYAPTSAAEKEYPYSEAVEIVLESLESFSPNLAGHARRVFDEDHMDSEIRPGKEGGAFCSSPLPGMAPWVKVNYAGRADDVATLAHELGHAVHALMARHHSVLTFHSSLPLAETASTFAEMLLTEKLLENEEDPAVRRNILAAVVDDAFATILRQAYFVLFERQAHEMIAEGKTTDDLRVVYLETLKEQFGDSLELDEDFQWEWVMIPHIYRTPFYCYAYSFGLLLVLSLFRQYKEEGPSFIPRYLRILSHGGSASPEQILTEAGVDMTSAAFWQGGFDVIRRMVREMEAL